MASRNYPSISLLFTAAALFVAGGVEARFKGINPWCRTSDYMLLCTKMVNGATTQDAATANAIKATIDVTARTRPQLDRLGAALSNLPSVTKDSIVKTCTESYGAAVDNLGEALSNLKPGSHYNVVDRIQAAESSFYDCTDAIKQMGGDATLGKSGKILFKFASNCLAVATQT